MLLKYIVDSFFATGLLLVTTALFLYYKDCKELKLIRKQWINLKEYEYNQLFEDELMAEWQATSGEDWIWN